MESPQPTADEPVSRHGGWEWPRSGLGTSSCRQRYGLISNLNNRASRGLTRSIKLQTPKPKPRFSRLSVPHDFRRLHGFMARTINVNASLLSAFGECDSKGIPREPRSSPSVLSILIIARPPVYSHVEEAAKGGPVEVGWKRERRRPQRQWWIWWEPRFG